MADFDLAVVGGGPGGIAAAIAAADAGRSVVMLDESSRPGGQVWRHLDEEPPAAARPWLRRLSQSSAEVRSGVAVVDLVREAEGPELEALARREKAIFIKIDPDVVRSRGPEPDQQAEEAVGQAWLAELAARGWRFSGDQVQFRNTVALDLQPSEETLLANMKQKTRYNIRLAERKGVVVRQGTAQDFELIAQMYETTAERNAFAIRPRAYYLDAWNAFYEAGMAQPFIAEYEGAPLGAAIVVAHGGRAIYMYGASTERERNRQPNYLLQWEAIRWAKERGCALYDFWGAPDEFVESDSLWGVWRFKSGFGADVVRHIGAWDYAPRRFWHWVYTVVVPRYVEMLRRRDRD